MLQQIAIPNFKTHTGKNFQLPLSYQIFGRDLHTAPIILVNHALTGNSNVAGEKGWWNSLIGEKKVVDLDKFTVLAFNVPGNGFDGFLIDDYLDFNTHDIAKIFLLGLKELKINQLFALIGGSVGGSIGWEMLALEPNLAKKFLPIATDYKTTDWLHSQCLVQEFLLNSDANALEKARIHAMLCYRTPESINLRFKREKDSNNVLKSEDWLNYHGKTLKDRFTLQAYKLMNHLLMSIDVSENDIEKINAEVHLISVDTDLFYPAFEIRKTHHFLDQKQKKVFYHQINSIHGHDAFLMEFQQLNHILKPIINTTT